MLCYEDFYQDRNRVRTHAVLLYVRAHVTRVCGICCDNKLYDACTYSCFPFAILLQHIHAAFAMCSNRCTKHAARRNSSNDANDKYGVEWRIFQVQVKYRNEHETMRNDTVHDGERFRFNAHLRNTHTQNVLLLTWRLCTVEKQFSKECADLLYCDDDS